MQVLSVVVPHSQGLIGFIHGHNDANPWSCTTCQCRSCHQFHEVEWIQDFDPECVGGGARTRDDRIVCPKCGSDRVRYAERFIT